MKKNTLIDSIGLLSDKMINESIDSKAKTKPKIIKWVSLVAAVLVIVMISIIVIEPFNLSKTPINTNSLQIFKASYPEMNKYPSDTMMSNWESYEKAYDAWAEDKQKQQNQYAGYSEGLESYLNSVLSEFLVNENSENLAFSPMNLYFALSMLSEVTDGESREAVLNLLGAKDINSLRKQAKAIWNANYSDDGVNKSLLANSIWISNSLEVYEEPLNILKDNYFASSYYGNLQSEEVLNAFKTWLNENTGNLLEDNVDKVEFSPYTLLALASTVYFEDRWEIEFGKGSTVNDVFYTDNGETEAEFMTGTEFGDFYLSDNFSAYKKSFKSRGGMWFILPDEDTNLNSILNEEATLNFIANNGEGFENKAALINLKLPKFDVTSDIKLDDGLKKLGLDGLYDAAKSNFGALTDFDLAVSEVKQSARVKIDEEGVEAAAFTVITADGAGYLPDDEIDFILDRPFIYVITGADGLPLFVGVINNP